MRVLSHFTTWLVFLIYVPVSPAQQKQAYLNVNRLMGSAVDANGLRHSAQDYPSGHARWLDDRIAVVAPKYPLEFFGCITKA
jgi:hypothetical protein